MPATIKHITKVLDYLKEHGADKTCIKYNITPSTLTRYERRKDQLEGNPRILNKPQRQTTTYIEHKDSADVSGQAKTLDELLKKANVDLTIWEVDTWEIKDNSYDVSAKWRDQDLTWTNGIMDGHAERRNEWLTNTNKQFYIRARLKRKKYTFDYELFRNTLIKDISVFSPKVSKIKYPSYTESKHALEISLFDIHFGKLGWHAETGENDYDYKIAEERFMNCLSAHITNGKNTGHNIEKITFPIGNDFFNSDTAYPIPTTTRGTPQGEDLRWQKMFNTGWKIIVNGIELCKSLAPVEIPIIPGNHDFQRSFYLGEVINAYYRNDPNVTINNSPRPQKYVEYGVNLIGYTHGNAKDISIGRLLMLMQQDVPQSWARTKFREWHLGDIHHEKKITLSQEDYQALVIRYLKSLSGDDGWHSQKGYKSIKGGESFLWNKKYGMVNNFHYNIVP